MSNNEKKIEATRKEMQMLFEEHPSLTRFGIGVYESIEKSRLTFKERMVWRKQEIKHEQEQLLTDTSIERQIIPCREWLKTFMHPRKTFNKNHSSYGIKHIIERDTQYRAIQVNTYGDFNHYLANGELIIAALLEGYKKDSMLHYHPNVCFNFSEKPLKEAIKRRRKR